MKSPCIAACKNNAGICSGCHRIIKEIIEWRKMEESKHSNIMRALSGERYTHECPSCNQPAHCDLAAGKTQCWCFDLETRDLSSQSSDHSCLCRHCLAAQPVA
ncbi:cysteine-rich CWC family protein [Vibrio olivae]|uniref:Cysteine-rich CWC family protein n=1 Tax=Vibrio olivae TaxID=1243002 RepID=A0ABV5HPV7_9VIBR